MKKLLLAFLLLFLLPVTAMATEITQDKHKIHLPEYDQLTVQLPRAEDWLIVTADNLEDNLAVVLARGDKEEEIRDRFADETLVFEAYSSTLPGNACYRLEIVENRQTREIWNFRHMSLEDRNALKAEAEMGLFLPYESFYHTYINTSADTSGMYGYYTNYPPTTLESGAKVIRIYNGTMYIMSYAFSGELKGNSVRLEGYGGVSLNFGASMLPQMPAFFLDDELPTQADVGNLTVSGTIRSGGTIKVELDGAELPVTLKSYEGKFTVNLPLTEEGDHEVIFTVNHPKNTQRVETYAVNVSSTRTALAFTKAPSGYVLAGEQTLTGISDPGATLVITLDESDPVTVTADETGAFSWSFDVPGNSLHHMHVMATAPDYKDSFKVEWHFLTVFETDMEGLHAFGAKLSGTLLKDLIADPNAHIGERVKVNAHIQRVDITEDGLGLYCKEYQDWSNRWTERYFYVTIYGYAQCRPSALMMLEIYGTVTGEREVNGEKLLEIDMQYGVLTTYK